MSNRRDFLKNASLLGAAGLVAGHIDTAHAATTKTDASSAKKTIGLQIYSLGNELFTDVPANLKKLKDYGYTTLELAGYNNGKIRDIDMVEFKKMTDDAGLKITSSHVNPPAWEYKKDNQADIAEFWKKAADDHAKIGTKYLVQPGQPATRSTEEVEFVGEIFNQAGEISKAAGLLFGYHNHDMEFARVKPGSKASEFGRHFGGEIIYDLMLKNTDPSLVLFEMDVYWAVMGQQDPVEYLKKYPNRIKMLHIKDRAVLGQSGLMNFEQIFKQAQTNGLADFFVELEGISGSTQFEGVRDCCTYLKKASFVK